MTKLLCVYCSSRPDVPPDYHAAAQAVGRDLVGHGWGLIYGGGKVGLMGSLARAVKASGGSVVGVIPDFMKAREREFREADELVTVATMAERKQIMMTRADAFLALPGGIGTLEELAEVITLRYLAQINKPIVLFNQNGFYDDLLRFFGRMEKEGFRTAGIEGLFSVASTLGEIWPPLKSSNPYKAEALWR